MLTSFICKYKESRRRRRLEVVKKKPSRRQSFILKKIWVMVLEKRLFLCDLHKIWFIWVKFGCPDVPVWLKTCTQRPPSYQCPDVSVQCISVCVWFHIYCFCLSPCVVFLSRPFFPHISLIISSSSWIKTASSIPSAPDQLLFALMFQPSSSLLSNFVF